MSDATELSAMTRLSAIIGEGFEYDLSQRDVAALKEVREHIYSLRALLSQAQADKKRAEEVLRELANHGTRHDITPTKRMPAKRGWSFEEAETNETWWHEYIREMDKSVRNEARAYFAAQQQAESQSGTNQVPIEDVARPDVDAADPRVDAPSPMAGTKPAATSSLPDPPEFTPELLAQIKRESDEVAEALKHKCHGEPQSGEVQLSDETQELAAKLTMAFRVTVGGLLVEADELRARCGALEGALRDLLDYADKTYRLGPAAFAANPTIAAARAALLTTPATDAAAKKEGE